MDFYIVLNERRKTWKLYKYVFISSTTKEKAQTKYLCMKIIVLKSK